MFSGGINKQHRAAYFYNFCWLSSFVKRSIIDAWQDPKYGPGERGTDK